MAENHSPETILQKALELDDPQARAAWLDEACGDDEALRGEMASLLTAHFAADAAFMDTLAEPAWQETPTEKEGDTIGRYKLLELIGEGGFGRVWMADQREPMQRRVALKIVKLGMDTGEVLARFEAERQALAMMDHPNIAQVFDGGVTEKGRPFFVMELVKGVPITEYCDVNKLPPRARIGLFRKVCQAVQHAHQKGIIHRDLKPSNILVTVKEDQALPKVIDFGVAKALDTRLTERTLFTRMNQWVGTPAYMSPEQAGLGSLDIDTRSDVYSLGTILYELLTGRTPFDEKELRREGYEAILRKIREEDAPKASTRLSTLTPAELTVIADHRGRTPQKLGHAIKGELDWILFKALERDRTRRYDTANALALDLERYVGGDPITAAPPTFAYQASKFFRKRWKFASIAAAFVALLVSGTGVSIWQAVQADLARKKEETQRLEAVRQRGKAEDTAKRLLQQEEQNRRLAAKSDLDLARKYMEDEDYPAAIAHLCRANRTEPDNESARWLLLSTLIYGAENLPARPVSVMDVSSLVAHAEFSPDSKTLVAIDGEGLLQAWETETYQRLFETQSNLPGGDLTMSDDGASVAISADYREKAGPKPADPEAEKEYEHVFQVFDLKSGRARSQSFAVPNANVESRTLRSVANRWELAVFRTERDPDSGEAKSSTLTIYNLETQENLREQDYEGLSAVNDPEGLLAFKSGENLSVHDLWTDDSRFPDVPWKRNDNEMLKAISITDAGRLLVTWEFMGDPDDGFSTLGKPRFRTQIFDRSDPRFAVREHRHESGPPLALPSECGLVVTIDSKNTVVPERPGKVWDEFSSDWERHAGLPESNGSQDLRVIGPDRYVAGNARWFGERPVSGRLPTKWLALNREGTRAAVQFDYNTLCVYDLSFPSALPEIEGTRTTSMTIDYANHRRIEANIFGCRFIEGSGKSEVRTSISHFGVEEVVVNSDWTRVATLDVLTAGEDKIRLGDHLRLWTFPEGKSTPLPAALRSLALNWDSWSEVKLLDDSTLLVTGEKESVVVNLDTGELRALTPPDAEEDARGPEGIPGFFVAPRTGALFYLADQRIFEVDPWSASPFQLLAEVEQQMTSALVAPDGQTILFLFNSGILSGFDIAAKKRLPGMQILGSADLLSLLGKDHVLVESNPDRHRGQSHPDIHLYELTELREVMTPVSGEGKAALASATSLRNRRHSTAESLLLISDEESSYQLWSAPGGQPLTPPIPTLHPPVLTHEGEILAAPSEWDGDSGSGPRQRFRRWEMPVLDVPLPDWFLDLAEAHAERRMNSFGVVEKIPPSAFLEAAEQVKLERNSPNTDLATIARWLIDPLDERSVSPFFECDREKYLDQLLEHPSALDAVEAASLETGRDPVRLARIGRRYCILGDWPLGEYYVARAVAMAPDDPEVRRIFGQVVDLVDPNRSRYPDAPNEQ